MDIAEVLELADTLVFSKTGKYLDHLQKTVLKGTIQDQTYPEIANENGFSESHVKNVGHELWHILSSALGEKVTKANFRSIFKNIKNPIFLQAIDSTDCQNNTTINNINIFADKEQSPTNPPNPQQTPKQPHIDLGDAPEIFRFYDSPSDNTFPSRIPQLSTLENSILQDSCRLIALLGISGIGKTTLSLQLINQIKTQFDYVIYRSLRFSPTLDTTITNLLQIFSPQSEIPPNIDTKISQIIKHLRNNRCLIVFDDVQMLFSSGESAGKYKSDCEDYQLFFKLIAEVYHQSCLLLNSWEKPREIERLEKDYHPVRSFLLGSLGVATKEILRENNLSDEERWSTLIDTYQGNPLWLELTATLIRELFGGRVAEFLQCEMPILDESLQFQLSQQFQRLTQAELAIMTHLANQPQPLPLSQFLNQIQLSPSELVNGVRSLRNRFLLEVIEEKEITLFSLNPVLKQYVKTRYSDS